ncbi:hypothetical protein EG68_00231 [Paragonimus skrjabini miyazakii]|uniref:Uncharacterized protein n=1 Tax=Paragonimus skrjabini miyazakii TaxID=59628 RepID=A0A8S9ZCI6_9TREM|nr:hypothetical protein EG68_00231 [Paragonimus skrjabini miyazakii]
MNIDMSSHPVLGSTGKGSVVVGHGLRTETSLSDCCWNPYFGRTLSHGIFTLPQSWSATVTDIQSRNALLVCYKYTNPQYLRHANNIYNSSESIRLELHYFRYIKDIKHISTTSTTP